MSTAFPLQIKVVYYLLSLPILAIIALWTFSYSKSFLDYFKSMDKEDKRGKKADIVKNEKARSRKLEVYFAAIFLVFLLTWNPLASDISDQGVHREIKGENALELYITDPVIHSLGPSYNTEELIEEMEERPNIWLPSEVSKYVDLDHLTRFPGRLAIYRMYEGRYIITYTYLSPYPIVKAYGFLLNERGDEIIYFYGEDTIIYPFNPSRAGDIAN